LDVIAWRRNNRLGTSWGEMTMKKISKGLTVMAIALAITGSSALAQSFGQERARAIGEMTDAAIVEALREDGRVSMSGGFFDTDSDALTGTSSEVLFKIASAMASLPEMRLVIVGHTDSVGDFNYNIDLAQRRANAVRNTLLGEPYNVAAERLVAMGAGPIAPVASNLGDEGRALNRRVEFVLLDEELRGSN
jgi:outer membrane protein OmpA-like peptidoglycan-associated protein